jgi:DNA-binding HxlR family transcriptional regulator
MLPGVKRSSVSHLTCSVARGLEVVGEWWTLLIVRDLFLGMRRFDEIRDSLGISRNILIDRLDTLVEHGLVERRAYQKHPPRSDYHLTDKGRDLYPVILALMRWGDTWLAGSAGPPVLIEHAACGRIAQPQVTCDHCGQPLTDETSRFVGGPGIPARDARGHPLARRVAAETANSR